MKNKLPEMEIHLQSLNCPNCGAPLNLKPGMDITFCSYCDSGIRISKHAETGEQSASHTGIPPSLVNEMKQLILAGKKAEAIDLYQGSFDISRQEAEKVIESLTGGITDKIILSRPLSAKGIVLCIFLLALGISAGYVLFSGTVSAKPFQVICWMIMIFALITLLAVSRSIVTTIKYFPKKWTKAVIIKFVFITEKKNMTFFKVLLEVKEPDGNTFMAETNIVMKSENIAKLQEGKIIDVKYLSRDKKNVIASVMNL
jgi:hypothetical protein